jgi:MFS family permease
MNREPHKLYYGWIIVVLGLVSMSFWFGVRSSFSVFYVALLEEFHWSRGESAGVQSMAMLTYTFIAPVVGGLIDRLGPRRVIVPGIFLLLRAWFCALIRPSFNSPFTCAGRCRKQPALPAIPPSLLTGLKGKEALPGIAVSGMGSAPSGSLLKVSSLRTDGGRLVIRGSMLIALP